MLAPVLGLVKTYSILIVGYLDDLILQEHLSQTLTSNICPMVQVLERLGWMLNLQKLAFFLMQ